MSHPARPRRWHYPKHPHALSIRESLAPIGIAAWASLFILIYLVPPSGTVGFLASAVGLTLVFAAVLYLAAHGHKGHLHGSKASAHSVAHPAGWKKAAAGTSRPKKPKKK